MRLNILAFSMTTLIAHSVAATEHADFFIMTTETVDCISENLDALEKESDGIIFVYPPTCPESPVNPLSVFTTAEAPDIAKNLVESDKEVDRLLIFSKSDLNCFRGNDLPSEKKTWLFYPSDCSFEPLR